MVESKSEVRNPRDGMPFRSLRLPIHFRRLMPRADRRADDLWAYMQAMVERLGIEKGALTVSIHQGRITEIEVAVRLSRGRVLMFEGEGERRIHSRIRRLLAGSALKYGTLTVEIVRGQVKWIIPAPRFKWTRDEVIELGRLFDGRE